jgi:hypothetical protein
MKIAVGIATATPIANEVSQADGRLEPNPTLAMVCTSDIVNDIAIAMIAGTRYGNVLGIDAVAAGPGLSRRSCVHEHASFPARMVLP